LSGKLSIEIRAVDKIPSGISHQRAVKARIRHFQATPLQSNEIVPSQDFLAVGQPEKSVCKGVVMFTLPFNLWNDEGGQDVAEYAVVLAVILVIVVGTIRLVGTNGE